MVNLLKTASTLTRIGICWCSSCYSPSKIIIVMSLLCFDLASFFSTLLMKRTLMFMSSLGCSYPFIGVIVNICFVAAFFMRKSKLIGY